MKQESTNTGSRLEQFEVDYFEREYEGIVYHLRTIRVFASSEAAIPLVIRAAGREVAKVHWIRRIAANGGTHNVS